MGQVRHAQLVPLPKESHHARPHSLPADGWLTCSPKNDSGHPDVQQTFVVFSAIFSMAILALVHGGVLERIRPAALYVMAAVIGLVLSPVASHLTRGPVGPLTNRGLHDFEGIHPLYIFAGV